MQDTIAKGVDKKIAIIGTTLNRAKVNENNIKYTPKHRVLLYFDRIT